MARARSWPKRRAVSAVTPETARRFGHDLARAIRQYLEEKAG